MLRELCQYRTGTGVVNVAQAMAGKQEQDDWRKFSSNHPFLHGRRVLFRPGQVALIVYAGLTAAAGVAHFVVMSDWYNFLLTHGESDTGTPVTPVTNPPSEC